MYIYNTMSRKKELFVPLKEGKVSMYACGPTVYNFFHIGNARPFIVFDTLRRYLEYRGYQVYRCSLHLHQAFIVYGVDYQGI